MFILGVCYGVLKMWMCPHLAKQNVDMSTFSKMNVGIHVCLDTSSGRQSTPKLGAAGGAPADPQTCRAVASQMEPKSVHKWTQQPVSQPRCAHLCS